MMRRGRKGTAALSVVSVEKLSRLRVPDGLSNAEANLFRDVVDKCAADHFTPSDGPMLVAYCQAILLTRGAFKMLDDSGMGFQQWQSAAKTMALLPTAATERMEHIYWIQTEIMLRRSIERNESSIAELIWPQKNAKNAQKKQNRKRLPQADPSGTMQFWKMV